MSNTPSGGTEGSSGGAITAMLVACALFVVGDSCIKLIGKDLALG